MTDTLVLALGGLLGIFNALLLIITNRSAWRCAWPR